MFNVFQKNTKHYHINYVSYFLLTLSGVYTMAVSALS